ncbi:MAG: hypothetical protein DDT19_00226 [Syntrophomonadaceae bacterium]|nr:hypothetical protein [Bacillota bacterium]
MIAKCRSCKYEWETRVASPKQCPRCKIPMWKRKKEESKINPLSMPHRYSIDTLSLPYTTESIKVKEEE